MGNQPSSKIPEEEIVDVAPSVEEKAPSLVSTVLDTPAKNASSYILEKESSAEDPPAPIPISTELVPEKEEDKTVTESEADTSEAATESAKEVTESLTVLNQPVSEGCDKPPKSICASCVIC